MTGESYTLSFKAQQNMPTLFRVIATKSGVADMSGAIHPNCVVVVWMDERNGRGVREAVFDADTGEYLHEN